MASKAMRPIRNYCSFIHRSQGSPGKIAWPELLGQGAGDAMKKIKEEKPEAVIEVLTLPCMYTLELRPNRVRLIIDGPGIVVRTPEVG